MTKFILLLAIFTAQEAARKLSIEIPADGKVRVAGATVEWKGLDVHLGGLRKEGFAAVTLRVDPSVPFSSVSEVMNACRRAGLATIEFASVKSDPPPKLVGGKPGLRIKIRDGARGPQIILLRETPVTSIAKLRKLLENTPKVPIIIDAEYETRYGLVKEVAEVCTKTGFRNISFAAPSHRRGTGVRRVLYVEHWPRWEYRFLKNAMIRDVKMRANILLTSSDGTFPQDHSPGLDPLQEFPRTLEDLMEYDVVIIGDVPPEKIGGRAALERIKKYVAAGGGLVMLAGTANNPLAYDDSPLEGLLPVVPTEDSSGDMDVIKGDLTFRLTTAGHDNGITRMLPNEETNSALWSRDGARETRLPFVRSFVRRRAAANATVLVEVEDPRDETAYPLFATLTHGKGRVFFSATDETYRWRRLRGDLPYFYPFWKRVIGWASGE